MKIESYNFKIDKENYKKYYLFRYFPSYERLESFLKNGIYLTRADKFTDNLECVNYENLIQINKRKNFNRLLPEHNPHLTHRELSELIEKANLELQVLAEKIEIQQKKYHISCWYLSQHKNENELMWRSYGFNYNNGKSGFLVRINLKDFIENLNSIQHINNQISNLVYGSVSYYDFNNDNSIQKVKFTGFRKHVSFKDENEFRLIFNSKCDNSLENIFLKIPNSLYYDTTIIAHPNLDLNEYHKIRTKLESNYDISLELSEIYIWYKLKKIHTIK